ncbi:MAG: DUF3553 domain-containing protein [Deltaproteobacteria bacterium]|nr:DUF3553 domain-containing protein [Deltaproteobacteria bacterium]
MDYKKGERVKHPSRPEWGPGKVLEDSRDDKVRVFFSGDGRKVLSLKYVEPVKISGAEARHPILDHLWIKQDGEGKYQNPQKLTELFLKNHPEGFYGPSYLKTERNLKVAAHTLALDLLGPGPMNELINQKNHEEICRRALKVVQATKLLFLNEKTALQAALKDPKNIELFAESLNQLLYGDTELEARFKSFSRALAEIKMAKWTILSYFLFIFFPDRFIFLKPVVTQPAAELSAFEINYRPELNWQTFQSVLDFSEYLRSELKELKPRDMIDIQSFMWSLGTHKKNADAPAATLLP